MGRLSKYDQLPEEIKINFIEKALSGKYSQREIADWLTEQGHQATEKMVNGWVNKLKSGRRHIPSKALTGKPKDIEDLKGLLLDRFYIDREIERLGVAVFGKIRKK